MPLRATARIALTGILLCSGAAMAQAETQPAGPTASAAGAGLTRLPGVWVEGPGYDITYGAGYDACAARCIAAARCQMIEYYRPEKKCNLYDTRRPTKPGGSSHVAAKRAPLTK